MSRPAPPNSNHITSSQHVSVHFRCFSFAARPLSSNETLWGLLFFFLFWTCCIAGNPLVRFESNWAHLRNWSFHTDVFPQVWFSNDFPKTTPIWDHLRFAKSCFEQFWCNCLPKMASQFDSMSFPKSSSSFDHIWLGVGWIWSNFEPALRDIERF